MSKEDFLKTLTEDQRYAVEFLLDAEYSSGYCAGKIAAEYDYKAWY